MDNMSRDLIFIPELHQIRRRMYLAGYGEYEPEIRKGVIRTIAFCEQHGFFERAVALRCHHGDPSDRDMADARNWLSMQTDGRRDPDVAAAGGGSGADG